MEIRICCDAFVKIEKANKIEEVTASVLDYNLEEMVLKGNVLIKGSYINEENISLEFQELVPITLLFKDDNVSVKEVDIENFDYYEIVNSGIQCKFEIKVDYYMSELANEYLNKEIEIDQEDKEIDQEDKEIEIENEPEIVNQIDEVETDEEDLEIEENDDLIENVKEKYDNLLKNIFSVKNREDDLSNVSGKDDNKVKLQIKDLEKGTYRIYYPKHENEIEKVCQTEKISVKDVYGNDWNKDFNNKRRIIIKK